MKIKSRLLLLILLILSFFSLSTSFMVVSAAIGVRTGDWAEYKMNIYSDFYEEVADIRVEILEIKDENITISITTIINGTIDEQSVITGEFEKTYFSLYIIPANLGLGDTYTDPNGNTTIHAHEEQTIGEEVRDVISTMRSSPLNNFTSSWDRETGILIEVVSNVFNIDATLFGKLVDTNLWQMTAQSSSSSFPLEYVAGILAAIVVVAIVVFLLRRK